MIYTVDASVESPIMLIDKHIGEIDAVLGVDGSLFNRELLQLDGMGKKSIEVLINTTGGSVYDGYAMMNAILNSRTPVDTYNIGMALSMGAALFLAGRKRRMADYAIFMMHMPRGTEDRNFQRVLEDSMVTMISTRCNLSDKKARKLLEEETWLTADECMALGICTEVVSTTVANKKWMPAAGSDVKQLWAQAKSIAASAIDITQIQQKNYTMNIQKVTARLGLMDGASEDMIVDAIKGINDKAYAAELRISSIQTTADQAVAAAKTAAEQAVAAAKAEVVAAQAELATTKTELENVRASLTKKEGEYNSLKTTADALQLAKDQAEQSEKENKAKTLVQASVKNGKIKNDVKAIEQWTKLAVADFDGTKEMIDALPLNKVANQFEKIEDVQASSQVPMKVAGSAEMRMIEIAAKNGQRTK